MGQEGDEENGASDADSLDEGGKDGKVKNANLQFADKDFSMFIKVAKLATDLNPKP